MVDGPRWTPPDALHPLPPQYFSDGPVVRETLSRETCEARMRYADSERLTLMMNENFVSDAMVAANACSEMATTALFFREPLARMHSHFQQIIMTDVRRLEGIHRANASLFAAERIFLRTPPRSATPGAAVPGLAAGVSSLRGRGVSMLPSLNVPAVARLLPTVSDNYYTRALGGGCVWRMPFGKLNQTHFQRALRVLNAIDWVVPLGGANNTALVNTHGLGFAQGTLPRERSSVPMVAPFSPADLEYLSALNRFDLALAAEATRLHNLDVASLEALRAHAPHAFELARRRPDGGKASCCGYACRYRGSWNVTASFVRGWNLQGYDLLGQHAANASACSVACRVHFDRYQTCRNESCVQPCRAFTFIESQPDDWSRRRSRRMRNCWFKHDGFEAGAEHNAMTTSGVVDGRVPLDVFRGNGHVRVHALDVLLVFIASARRQHLLAPDRLRQAGCDQPSRVRCVAYADEPFHSTIPVVPAAQFMDMVSMPPMQSATRLQAVRACPRSHAKPYSPLRASALLISSLFSTAEVLHSKPILLQ